MKNIQKWQKRYEIDKMVYYVDNNDIIHISAFWDCHREPIQQTKHLE
ncbi:MAG: hypothetical protein IKR41_05840 [Bacteroidales bacterium]|nr:hypothetical protein [Bacteroidales bacterium]